MSVYFDLDKVKSLQPLLGHTGGVFRCKCCDHVFNTMGGTISTDYVESSSSPKAVIFQWTCDHCKATARKLKKRNRCNKERTDYRQFWSGITIVSLASLFLMKKFVK